MPAKSARAPIRQRDLRGKRFLCYTVAKRPEGCRDTERTMKNGENDLPRSVLALLRQYNQEPFHIQHALTVEAVMRWFANDLGYGEEADFWAMCGLLHDIDFEKWPEQHCVKAPSCCVRPGWVRR